jgi:predicted RNA-binding Zn-ribbon protein involved in translation (DUF1610 family)
MSSRNKEQDKQPHNAQLTKLEPKSIKCPACGAQAFNDPNNEHLEAYTKAGDKANHFRTVRSRQFIHHYFCTKCTRATHFVTEV